MLKPATKFLGNSPLRQLLHVYSELFEVTWEIVLYSLNMRHKVGQECADLQTSTETLMAVCGYDKFRRDILRDCVYHSNIRRGYMEDKK